MGALPRFGSFWLSHWDVFFHDVHALPDAARRAHFHAGEGECADRHGRLLDHQSLHRRPHDLRAISARPMVERRIAHADARFYDECAIRCPRPGATERWQLHPRHDLVRRYLCATFLSARAFVLGDFTAPFTRPETQSYCGFDSCRPNRRAVTLAPHGAPNRSGLSTAGKWNVAS